MQKQKCEPSQRHVHTETHSKVLPLINPLNFLHTIVPVTKTHNLSYLAPCTYIVLLLGSLNEGKSIELCITAIVTHVFISLLGVVGSNFKMVNFFYAAIVDVD